MLAVIGGSGFYTLTAFEETEQIIQSTPYGETSSPISLFSLKGRSNDAQFCFLARHGVNHSIPPHKVNYRANIFALKSLGVTKVVAINAVGSCNTAMKVGDYILVDQCIDYTYGREHTFHNTLLSFQDHIDFTVPVSVGFHRQMSETLDVLDIDHHDSGVYACTQGPRFETAAEVGRIQRDGGDVIGMTMMPEAALARERSLAYASIAVVVNPAAGLHSGELIEESVITKVLDKSVSDVSKLVENLIT